MVTARGSTDDLLRLNNLSPPELLELDERPILPRTLLRRLSLVGSGDASVSEGGWLAPRAEKEVPTLLVVPDRERDDIRSASLVLMRFIIDPPFRFILMRMSDNLLCAEDVPECAVGVERPEESHVARASRVLADTTSGIV